MPPPRRFICFACGLGVGVCAWHLLALETQLGAKGKSSRATAVEEALEPAPVTRSEPTPAVPPSALKPLPKPASAAAGGRYHLWEALALRGVQDESLAKWLALPSLTGTESGFSVPKPSTPLHPDFIAFFDLTPEEQAGVQALLHDTLQRQLEMDRTRLSAAVPVEDEKFVAEIPDYSAEAAPLRQAYESQLRTLLGEARYQVYREWGIESFRKEFPGLAGRARRYDISPKSGIRSNSLNIRVGLSTTSAKDMADVERITQLPLSRLFGTELSANARPQGTENRAR